MADTSYLFGGSNPASLSQTLSDTSTSLPGWLQEYTRGLAGQGTAVAGTQYQNYAAPTNVQNYGAGTRIAGLNPQQTQAYSQVSANVGNYQPYLDTASQTLPQAVDQYMSPYIGGVTNEIARLGQRNLSENLLPQVNQTFTGAGQFGGTRNAEFTNRAVRDANESILGQQSQAMQTGFQNAMQNANADLSRQAQLGQLTQQLGAQDVGLLESAGMAQQGQQQKAMDLAYQDFLQQRDYQKNQLSFLSDIIRGMPVSQTGYATQSAVPSSTAQMSPLAAAAQGFLGARSIMSPTSTAATATKP
jgi:hypothetical protein